MWISTAYAQTTGIFDQNALIQFLPLILIFVVFYFLLIRPQQRKAKDHKTMLDALRRGDRVVTGGGIIGTVARVDNPEEVTVDIADNVRVRVMRSTIQRTCQTGSSRRPRGREAEDGGARQGRDKGVRSDRLRRPRVRACSRRSSEKLTKCCISKIGKLR
ncbi:MAG: preprotein translocase subunit YajC [Alphaproteobacteria bacterium]|nr:preprotein translocase subunit YajC [Alphaproteobacteria bacterium]